MRMGIPVRGEHVRRGKRWPISRRVEGAQTALHYKRQEVGRIPSQGQWALQAEKLGFKRPWTLSEGQNGERLDLKGFLQFPRSNVKSKNSSDPTWTWYMKCHRTLVDTATETRIQTFLGSSPQIDKDTMIWDKSLLAQILLSDSKWATERWAYDTGLSFCRYKITPQGNTTVLSRYGNKIKRAIELKNDWGQEPASSHP